MSEASSERVTCPSCGKGYRWQAKLAGRVVPCKQCDTPFGVPEAPGVGLALEPEPGEGGYDLAAPEIDQPRQLAAPAEGGKCPECNSPVKEHAVICINCGFNMEAGRKMARPAVDELSPEDRRESERNAKAPIRGMTLVRIGLWLNLLSILAVILAIPFEFADSGPAPLISALLLVGSGLMAFVGYLLCLAAPGESGGRPVLIVSIVLSAVALGGMLAVEFGGLSDDLMLAFDITDSIATACFLFFFVMLARYLAFPEITERAEKVFGLFLVVAIGQYLLILPIIGCIVLIILIGAAVYFTVLYVMLLLDLNSALKYRIGEQKAEHAY